MAGRKEQSSEKKAATSYSTEELRHLRALGRAIADLRESHTAHSRFQFAHVIDVHRNSMNAIENGQVSVGFLQLKKIVDGLGVSMSELMSVYEKELAADAAPKGRRS